MSFTENAELYKEEPRKDKYGCSRSDDSEKSCCPKVERKLIPAKFFYFFYFSSLGSLLPYLALYFKQMKLTPSQVGILMGLKPFVEFICTPLWGTFVDRFKTGKSVLLLSLFVTALSQFSLSLVAPAERLCTLSIISRSIEGRKDSSNISTNHGNSSTYWNDFVFVSSMVDEHPWPLAYASKDVDTPQTTNTTELFIVLLVIILVSNVISSPSLALADTVTMQTLRPSTHLYGCQRLWGSVGWGIASFLVGALVSLSHHCPNPFTKPSEINYMPCFGTFGVLMLFALVTSTQFKFAYDSEDAKVKNAGLMTSLKQSINIKYTMFLFTAFYFGILNAFMKTFLFWHLKDLGGTQILFSVIAAVNCFAEVSLYVLSDRIIRRMGHTRVIYLAAAGFTLRCLWYSFLSNPWLVLPLEFMPGITNALAWVAMLSYVNEISTSDNATTHQGILYGFYRGLGYGCGEVLGGVMINFVGSGNAFKVFALGAAFTFLGNIFVENLHQVKQSFKWHSGD